MTDFAPNYTGRLRIRYIAHGKEHTLLVRNSRDGNPIAPDFVTGIGAALSVIMPQMVSDWRVIGMTYALTDSDVFLPTPNTLVTITGANAQGPSLALSPHNINFQGITAASGNRASFYLYGFVSEPPDNAPPGVANYRITQGENALVDEFIEQWQVIPDLVGSDNQMPIWYNYGNININSYYQRKARR